MNHPDTVTHPPPSIPRGTDPATFKTDVETIVDARIRMYDEERRRRDAEARQADIKQRAMTYGVGGAIGLLVGVGGTLVAQRLRRGRGGSMKP